jgi:hypothetical protein
MTRQTAFRLLLVLVLAVVALALRGKGRLPSTPEDAVRRLFEAAQRGDAPAYLATLTGTLRSSFESSRSQMGAAAFSASLRQSMAAVKGFAVSTAGGPSPEEAGLDVELVFADHNERQRFVLVRQGGGWLVAAIEKADAYKPPRPYGSPAPDADAR